MPDLETDRLWRRYLAAEQNGVRPTMKDTLERFIDELLGHSPQEWHTRALQLAREVADEGRPIPIRDPLFRRVLLPALIEGVRVGRPDCARWLAHFGTLLSRYRREAEAAGLAHHLSTKVGLLSEAVRLDPRDATSRRKLIEAEESYLRHTLHELPAGVLYGVDGASAEQCVELLGLLDEFKSHVEAMGMMETYRELIERCSVHFRSYREYLIGGRPGGSYEAYLANWRDDV